MAILVCGKKDTPSEQSQNHVMATGVDLLYLSLGSLATFAMPCRARVQFRGTAQFRSVTVQELIPRQQAAVSDLRSTAGDESLLQRDGFVILQALLRWIESSGLRIPQEGDPSDLRV